MDPMTKASSPSRGSNRLTLMAQTLRVMRTSASRRGRLSPRHRGKLFTLKIVAWARVHCQEIKRVNWASRAPESIASSTDAAHHALGVAAPTVSNGRGMVLGSELLECLDRHAAASTRM